MAIIGKYIYENNFLYLNCEKYVSSIKLVKNETEFDFKDNYLYYCIKAVIQSDFKPIKGSLIVDVNGYIKITKNYIKQKEDKNKIKNWHFKAASCLNKLEAIKAYRNVINIGLKEAKDAIDLATSGAQFMTPFTTLEYEKIQSDPILKSIYVPN